MHRNKLVATGNVLKLPLVIFAAGFLYMICLLPILVQPVWGEDGNIDFDIPPSSANHALNLFARQADVRLLYPYDVVKNIKVNGLQGRFAVNEGVALLLRDTCLEAIYSGGDNLDNQVDENNKGNAIVIVNTCRKKTLAAALLSAMSSIPGVAAESGQQQARLEEVIVTAQKREQALQDIPLSAEVFSETILSNSKIDSTVDLAMASPSINFQQGWSPFISSFGMRGVNTFALEGGIQPSVSFVVDGVPIARVGEFQAELGDVQRIEVLRGPQGTLFGRNATAGAINVVRKGPTADFEASVEGSVTNDNEYITKMVVSGPLSDRVRARVSTYTKNLDGYIDNIYPGAKDEGGEKSWGLLGKLEVDLTDRTSVLFTAEYTKRDTSSVPNIALIPESGDLGVIRRLALGNGDISLGQKVLDDPFKISANQSTVSDTESWGLAADFSWDIAESIRLKSITSYRSFFLSNSLDVDSTPASATNTLNQPIIGWERTNYSPNGGGDPFTFETDYFSQEVRLEGEKNSFDWILGGFYQLYTDRPKSETPLMYADYVFEPGAGLPGDGVVGNNYYFDANPVEAKGEWESWAIFADTTWHLTDRLNVFAGLRWTQEDIDLRYSRMNIIGPASEPYFRPVNGEYVILDLPALQADPLWGLFQGVTKFKRSDRSEDWSGRVGASWDFGDNANVYFSASRGFIGSGVNFGRNASKTNSIIDPSLSTSYELGLKSELLENTLRMNLAAFWQKTTDLQTSGMVPGTVINETFNAGTLVSRGLELNLTWLPTGTTKVDLSATIMDTEIKDLLQPCYVGQTASQGCTIDLSGDGVADNQDVSGMDGVLAPDISYRISLLQDIPLISMPFDAYILANYTWQDETYMTLDHDPLAVRGDFGVVDLFIGIEDKRGRYSLSIFGKNITDELYYNHLSVTNGFIARLQGHATRDAQRYFGLKAKYNF